MHPALAVGEAGAADLVAKSDADGRYLLEWQTYLEETEQVRRLLLFVCLHCCIGRKHSPLLGLHLKTELQVVCAGVGRQCHLRGPGHGDPVACMRVLSCRCRRPGSSPADWWACWRVHLRFAWCN